MSVVFSDTLGYLDAQVIVLHCHPPHVRLVVKLQLSIGDPCELSPVHLLPCHMLRGTCVVYVCLPIYGDAVELAKSFRSHDRFDSCKAHTSLYRISFQIIEIIVHTLHERSADEDLHRKFTSYHIITIRDNIPDSDKCIIVETTFGDMRVKIWHSRDDRFFS